VAFILENFNYGGKLMIVNTYKELLDIAGSWPTVQIRNDYVSGAKSFTITYSGKSVTFQNEDVKKVAACAHNYNGLKHYDYIKFLNQIGG